MHSLPLVSPGKPIFSHLILHKIAGFSGGSDSKESACNAQDLGSVPRFGRFPGGGHGNPLQYSCLENPHGRRSLVGYSPCCHKESDMTEQLSTAQHRAKIWRERVSLSTFNFQKGAMKIMARKSKPLLYSERADL